MGIIIRENFSYKWEINTKSFDYPEPLILKMEDYNSVVVGLSKLISDLVKIVGNIHEFFTTEEELEQKCKKLSSSLKILKISAFKEFSKAEVLAYIKVNKKFILDTNRNINDSSQKNNVIKNKFVKKLFPKYVESKNNKYLELESLIKNIREDLEFRKLNDKEKSHLQLAVLAKDTTGEFSKVNKVFIDHANLKEQQKIKDEILNLMNLIMNLTDSTQKCSKIDLITHWIK